ncbi:MAG: glucose 1-dehydrogenase [Deltaproteobacteria bacterium]|nr:glucose 1-dehydrogenase [Deltaproteobacteria bacterium]MBW2360744.1 glucose 1-dehydrogenase [Deltaproteobacteria bacterium]
MRLEGKIALVTGAGRGLGEAIARRFSLEGATVYAADIDHDAAKSLAADCPNVIAVAHDVAREESWQSVLADIAQAHGRLNILVNNAGVFQIKPLLETSLAEYRRIIDVNQQGCFLGMREGAGLIKETGGAIVNISSTQGFEGLRGASSYVASKFAVRGMTKVAALELAEFGIRVNSVHPGAMNTAMMVEGFDAAEQTQPTRNPLDDLPLKRAAETAEVANLVLFLASDEASYCTGSEYLADGGLLAGPPF